MICVGERESEPSLMNKPDELRAEVDRLQAEALASGETSEKIKLATRALYLAQRAEALERLQAHPGRIRESIARYKSMLGAGIDDEDHRQNIEIRWQMPKDCSLDRP